MSLLLRLRVRLLWAVLTRNHLLALIIRKEILMADLTVFNEAVQAATARAAAVQQELAALQASDAQVQQQINAAIPLINAIAPSPAPAPAAETAAAEQPAA